MEYILKTNGLCKQYKSFKALNGLTMNVPKGSIYGFVGKNGAGKTTLIRLICGLQFPTEGSFEIYGTKNTDAGICSARRRIGAVVETPSIFPEMTAQLMSCWSWSDLLTRERKRQRISRWVCARGWE